MSYSARLRILNPAFLSFSLKIRVGVQLNDKLEYSSIFVAIDKARLEL